jgi:hypothetical protein
MKLVLPNKNVYIMSTRFSNETAVQNAIFREKVKFNGCIYPTPKALPPYIKRQEIVVVLEMNNTTNQIIGVGTLENRPYHKRYKVYEEPSYNRMYYKGKFRVDRSYIEKHIEYMSVLKKLETICFKGKDHIKRGRGITSVPPKKMKKLLTKKEVLLFMKLCGICKNVNIEFNYNAEIADNKHHYITICEDQISKSTIHLSSQSTNTSYPTPIFHNTIKIGLITKKLLLEI